LGPNRISEWRESLCSLAAFVKSEKICIVRRIIALWLAVCGHTKWGYSKRARKIIELFLKKSGIFLEEACYPNFFRERNTPGQLCFGPSIL
jgi:hypothetical protein